MSNLTQRQQKIQDKRKNTPRRDFVLEIVSRFPAVFHKNQGYISRYPETDRVGHISSNQEFENLRLSIEDYTSTWNEDQGFFKQFQQLLKSVPLSATVRQMAGENTDYADSVVASSNAYLSSVLVNDCSNTIYSFIIFDYCKDIVDGLWVSNHSENIYNSVGIDSSTNIFYSRYVTNSSNIWFSANMVGCHECILCTNLENQSHCIKNKQYSKEEYKKIKNKLLKNKSQFASINNQLPLLSNNNGSENFSGNHVVLSNNVENAYFTNRLSNAHNVICVGGENQETNYFDCFDSGVSSHDIYGVEGAGYFSDNLYCSTQIEKSSHIFYSYYLNNCSYCLGCIGLKNKSYCIFNKQYTKEERYDKVDEIFSQMEGDGDLGKFFPGSMNPFYFNDTAAYLIDDSFTKEEVEAKGYMRRDEPIKVDIPEGATVVKTSELDQYEGRITDGTFTSLAEGGSWSEGSSWSINPDILKVIIQDEKSNVYRIIPMEYKFLKKHGLPLPRKHWLERLKDNFAIG